MFRKAAYVVIALFFGSSSFAADEVKKLNASDLTVETHKWQGKKIETVMSCFYADVEDYRCVGGRARVDFSTISNEEGKQHIEQNCDTVDKSMSNRCTLRIVFVYEDFERREVNRSENLTYISAQDEKGEVFPAERKRR